MNDNRPEYEETPRMAEFRKRKEKEMKRRRRNKRLLTGFVIVLVTGAVGAGMVTVLRLGGLDYLSSLINHESSAEAYETVPEDATPSVNGEAQSLAESLTKQNVQSESKNEDAKSEKASEVEAKFESGNGIESETGEAENGEAQTDEAEMDSTETNVATKTTTKTTTKTGKKHEDPREDVWNHYTNMFIASKVNTYLNVRNQPTTDGTIIGKLTKYSGGELIEDLGNGWWHISSGGIDGYIWSENCVTGDEAKEVALEHCMQMVEVTTDKLNVRSGPGLEYDVWTTLNANEKQVVEERDGDWLKIAFNSTYGYINAEYVKTGFYLVEAIPWSSISDCSPTRQQILLFGEQYLGTPYVYGGTSLTDGIDCSSFVQQCYASAGFSLPRTSREQATRGTEISLDQAKPGDLLFYADATGTIDHVVMYLGDGKILHAALSLGQVTISKYNYSTEPVRVVNIIGD